MGDLLALLVHPLAGADHLDASVRMGEGQSGFGLEIGVLLGVGPVGGLDNDIGLLKTGLDFAVDQAVFEHVVGAEIAFAVGKGERVGMQDRCVRRHGLKRIGDDGQRLVLDVDQRRGGFGLRLGLGDDQRHMIGLPAHDLGLRRAARSAQHRLVGHDQSVLVDGHVFGRSNMLMTPGADSASRQSTDRMRPWGNPAKRIFSHAWSGRSMSPA